MNHIPDTYDHLERYFGEYSDRSRGARRLPDQNDEPVVGKVLPMSPKWT